MSMQSGRCLAFAGVAALVAMALPQAAMAQATGGLSAADRAAVFKASGAVQRHGQWFACVDDPHGGEAEIGEVRDLDGDGRPEVVVVGHGTFCYGHAETGYTLLSKQADGGWKRMDANSGIPEFLQTRGKDGWPDISVGGPGFCFPVLRWNGREYAVHRHEYEGKPCRFDP
jgi:hypothetical protein